ncbi:hypothetical protein KCP69_01165 [Salmonella enterica subsp. enterica]|nr:hypothetical protein KCP69_01165 [Salmonella enterica subsp. enterica]
MFRFILRSPVAHRISACGNCAWGGELTRQAAKASKMTRITRTGESFTHPYRKGVRQRAVMWGDEEWRSLLK